MNVARNIPLQWVCFAVREEMRPFARRVGGRGGLRLLLTGMGAANARLTLEQAFASATAMPDWVISSGFAGGLNPTLKRGRVVFEMGDGLPATGAGSTLKARLLDAGAVAGRFLQSDRVAVVAEEKQVLHRSSGADAVEMESGAIREVCAARGIPCAVVRVISDAADETLPLDFNALMTSDQRMDFVRLAGQLLRRPRLVPNLIRFQRRLGEAAEQLATVLEAITAGAIRPTGP
jgi:nucleoside phosphorylase